MNDYPIGLHKMGMVVAFPDHNRNYLGFFHGILWNQIPDDNETLTLHNMTLTFDNPDNSAGKASTFGAGGRGFEFRPHHTKGVKMVHAALFLTLA